MGRDEKLQICKHEQEGATQRVWSLCTSGFRFQYFCQSYNMKDRPIKSL